MTWLPLPGVQSELEAAPGPGLDRGIGDVNQVLAYTLQFIPAVRAVKRSPGGFIKRSDLLAMRMRLWPVNPFDWDLVRYGSVDLANHLMQ